MKLHPRVLTAQLGASEITKAVWDVVFKHDLSNGETMMALGETIQSVAKYILREERHPKHPDHEGGLMCDRKGCPGREVDGG